MKSTNVRRFAAAGVGAAMLTTGLIGLSATPASASTTDWRTPKALVTAPEATPKHYVGACPATVSFESKIKVRVKGTTKVAYQWLHGDGSKSKVKVVTVRGHGVKTITVKEDATFSRSIRGWQALRVLAPFKATTAKTHFSVACAPKRAKKPAVAKAFVDVENFHGVCTPSRRVTAEGVIRVSRPTSVTYRWIHNGKVVDWGRTKVWGAKKVSYSFAPGRSHRGWVKLDIVHPRRAKGDADSYVVNCVRPGGHHKPGKPHHPRPEHPKPRLPKPAPATTAQVAGISVSPDNSSCVGTKGPRVNFTGRISISGPGTFSYRWTANGVSKSGSMRVNHAGTYPVSFSIDGDPHGSKTYGTVTLEVTSPNASSASESFSFSCPQPKDA
jgi:hypothetical protein